MGESGGFGIGRLLVIVSSAPFENAYCSFEMLLRETGRLCGLPLAAVVPGVQYGAGAAKLEDATSSNAVF